MDKKLRTYLTNESGQMAIMFALGSTMLFAGVGAAISMSDLHTQRSNLQSHADIISLASAKMLTEGRKGKLKAKQYLNEYNSSELQSHETCKAKLSVTTVTSTINCEGNMKNLFASFVGKDSLKYSVTSTATMAVPKANEISSVFDISESMHGREIKDLKDGLRALINSDAFTHQESRLSLIPFAATVRLSDSFQSKVASPSGFAASGGIYNGCFEPRATDLNTDFKTASNFILLPSTGINVNRRYCPPAEMTPIYHTNPKTSEVRQLIRNIDTTWGTGSSDALMWGYRSLTPDMRGVLSDNHNYPLSSSESIKHLIFMTDGKPSPGRTNMTKQEARERFDEFCEKIPFEANNIHVHMINYNSNLSGVGIQRLKNCVSGSGKYYEVNVGELPSILNDISGQAEELRISN